MNKAQDSCVVFFSPQVAWADDLLKLSYLTELVMIVHH
jgi:hypothetical protein